jgi:hypothetical protein
MKYKAWYKKFWDFADADQYQQWVMVKEVEADSLSSVYYQMQAEVWSPNGEARDLIRSMGLSHTSMSVGDFIENPRGEFFRVEGCGFEVYSGLPTTEKIGTY